MNKLIKDSEEIYKKEIEKEYAENLLRLWNVIVRIFGTEYLNCFTFQPYNSFPVARINDSDLVLSLGFNDELFMQNIKNSRFSTNPINNFKSFYQNFSMLKS